MVYIILTITLSVLLLVFFKLFETFKINTFGAIVINYFAAAITGFIFSLGDASFKDSFEPNLLAYAVPLGLLFISIFYLISQTAQKINIATASIANKMSVVIPVVFAIIFLNQTLNTQKVFGILLALVAVYLSTRVKSSTELNKKLIYLPIAVFFGSGAIDVILNLVNVNCITNPAQNAVFSILTFMVAFFAGLLVITYTVIFKNKDYLKEVLTLKTIIAGVLLGIPNYFSIYFIFKALDTKLLQGAELFPVLNLCNVALAAVVGWLCFKDKLSVVNVVGIILALASIILIAF